jgi:protein SYS1
MLAVIVEKSKKCLDFAVTLFFLHLVISTFYGGFPARLDWWVVHIAATILMVLLGEYLCSRRELDEIPLLQL